MTISVRVALCSPGSALGAFRCAKGVVYLLVGLFAAQTALMRGGDVIGGVGALQVIFTQPLGAALLMVMIAGLAAYVL